MNHLKNALLVIKDQLPLKRLWRNWVVTRNSWGLFHVNAHVNQKTKEPKVAYKTKGSALKGGRAHDQQASQAVLGLQVHQVRGVPRGESAMTTCACMGPQRGDPYCYCEMIWRGLKPTDWSGEEKARLKEAFVMFVSLGDKHDD